MLQLLADNPYIPWDVSYFTVGVKNIVSSLGGAFNVGMILLLGIWGILAVKNLISYFLEG